MPTLHEIAFAKAREVTDMVMNALELWRERTLRDQRELTVQAFEEVITAPGAAGDTSRIDRAAQDVRQRWIGSKLERTRAAIATLDPSFIVENPQQLPDLGRMLGEIYDESADLLRADLERSVAEANRKRSV